MRKNESLRAISDGFKYVSFSKLGNHITHEQLIDIEGTRTKLYEKAKNFDQFHIFHSFVGTMIPDMLTSPLAWGMAAEYIIIRVLLKKKIIFVGVDVPQINTTIISIVGSFMSFFLVFFLSQAYTRFMAQYTVSKNLLKCINRIAYGAKNSLPFSEAMRLVRYLNAAHIAGYVGLSNAYSVENLFHPLNDKYHLLTDKEVERLKSIDMDAGSSALREIVGWCFNLIYDNYRKGNESKENDVKAAAASSSMDFITFQTFLSDLYQFNGSFADLFNYAEQTFPFSYMHLLVVINAMYLIIITYTIATFMSVGDNVFPDLLGAFILMSNLVFVTGMREIGGHMIDPYGNDVTDLSIISYIQAGVKSSMEILHGKQVGPAVLKDELELQACRPPLRAAFTKKRTSFLKSLPFFSRSSIVGGNNIPPSEDYDHENNIDEFYPTGDNPPPISNSKPFSSSGKENGLRSPDNKV